MYILTVAVCMVLSMHIFRAITETAPEDMREAILLAADKRSMIC